MDVAIKYLNVLLPLFFSDKTSPYLANLSEGVSEHQIQILNEHNYYVTQTSQFNVCLKENPQEILATVSFSWRNEPTLTPSQIKGWSGVLKIDCKVHNLDHWEPIMEHLVTPNAPTGPQGLHFSREITTY